MQRIPEPELMDDPAQALAYARADFTEPHNQFVALLRDRCRVPAAGRALDLGCGPGDITRRVATAWPGLAIDGVDGAAAMVELGRQDMERAGLHPRVTLHQGYLPGCEIEECRYDLVISNSLLHHLAEPAVLWEGLWRAARPGAPLFVMDLRRPDSAMDAQRLVDEYAAGEPEVLRKDFYHSLLAAYTPDEVRAQLRAAGLTQLRVETVSDRHLIVYGQRG